MAKDEKVIEETKVKVITTNANTHHKTGTVLTLNERIAKVLVDKGFAEYSGKKSKDDDAPYGKAKDKSGK